MSVKVVVVDVPLGYNMLLFRNYIYAKKAIVSLVFHVVNFPYEYRIATINQLTFDNSSSFASPGPNILVIDNS